MSLVRWSRWARAHAWRPLSSLTHRGASVCAKVSDKPNVQDTKKLLAIAEARGFPRMLASIDCMHCQRKNYPRGLCSMYHHHTKEATIILEAVASHDLWVWHSLFGMYDSHNDIHVLQQSPMFRRLCNSESPPCNYTFNACDRNMRCYLANVIYPQWRRLWRPYPNPTETNKATLQQCKRQLGGMWRGL